MAASKRPSRRKPAPKKATPTKNAAPTRRAAAKTKPRGAAAQAKPDAPHVASAIAYAKSIVAGKIPAAKWTRLAAQRFLRDLGNQTRADFSFRLDHSAAERFCRFAELLRHYKGPKAGQLFHLEDWQCFVAVNLFGWIHKKTGKRRFRRFYLEVARGNGKSFFLATILIYMAFADGEAGAEAYSAATTRDQAKIVFNAAKEIVRRSTDLQRALGVSNQAHAIVQVQTASSLLALAAEDHTLDGLNSHVVGIDELHAHKTRGVHDVLETSIGKRDQPLLAMITTAGSDRTGICYEVRTDLTKVLDGTATDESFFGVIYTIDEEDDWRDETTWAKANPNLGISVNLATLRDLAKKAERMPAAQNAFKTKHLNVWVGANAALYDIDEWNACADPTLDQANFAGEPCISAIDLATKNDLAPRVDVFSRPGPDGQPHYYVFGRHYLPQDAVDDGRNAQYHAWALDGWLTVTPGPTTDQGRIEADLLEDSERFEFQEIGYDPWQAQGLAQRLAAQGATMVEIRQVVANFSEPTKELGALMQQRRIHHNGDPVLAWAISNVVGHYDVKENVYPRKERPENKIDPAVALIAALGRWLRRELDPRESEYDRRARLDREATERGEDTSATPPAALDAPPPAGRRSIYDSPEWQELAR